MCPHVMQISISDIDKLVSAVVIMIITLKKCCVDDLVALQYRWGWGEKSLICHSDSVFIRWVGDLYCTYQRVLQYNISMSA